MSEASDFADPRAFLPFQPFVQELGIDILSVDPGEVTVTMPFATRFSTPPSAFPASMVGILGDVGAVCACLTRLPEGWAAATLDYTVKMTGRAQGEALLAKSRVLQAGKTTSVGQSDVFTVKDGRQTHCGVVLVTTRNFQIK